MDLTIAIIITANEETIEEGKQWLSFITVGFQLN